VPFRLSVWVSINEAVDTGGAEGGSSDALALGTGPSARFLAAADGFDDTSNDGGFGCLLPLLAGIAAPRSVAHTAVIVTPAPAPAAATSRPATASVLAGDGGYNSAEACAFD
jgi:hypothetical protein